MSQKISNDLCSLQPPERSDTINGYAQHVQDNGSQNAHTPHRTRNTHTTQTQHTQTHHRYNTRDHTHLFYLRTSLVRVDFRSICKAVR